MVIVACHRWCIKLHVWHIRNMAEASLVARDGNSNHNSSPTFLFSVWVHPRIPRVSKNMDASCMRKSNGQRIRKRTWPIHSSSVREQNVVHSLRWVARFSWSSTTSLCSLRWWFSARFPQYRKWSILRELVEVVCNTHFRLSLLSFLHLTLLLDSV